MMWLDFLRIILFFKIFRRPFSGFLDRLEKHIDGELLLLFVEGVEELLVGLGTSIQSRDIPSFSGPFSLTSSSSHADLVIFFDSGSMRGPEWASSRDSTSSAVMSSKPSPPRCCAKMTALIAAAC